MKLHSKKIGIALILLIAGLFQLTHAANAVKQSNSDTAIQNDILVYINEYRLQHGLNPLTMDNRIVAEAKKHSRDMATHNVPFGHKHFLSRIDRLHSRIKNSGAGAENVAYNYKDAQDVVKNWLRSPGHKRNIDGNYNITGIGVARDRNGKIYFTQIFLRTGTAKYASRRPYVPFFNKPLFKKIA